MKRKKFFIFTLALIFFIFSFHKIAIADPNTNTPAYKATKYCRDVRKFNGDNLARCEAVYLCAYNNYKSINGCYNVRLKGGKTVSQYIFSVPNSSLPSILRKGAADHSSEQKKNKKTKNVATTNRSGSSGSSSAGGSSSSSDGGSKNTKPKKDKEKELSAKDLKVTYPDKAKSGAGYVCGNSKKDKDGAVKTYINLGCKGDNYDGPGGAIGDMFFAILRFLSIGVGVVITISIIASGIQYTTSEGNPETTMAAKKRIQWSVLSLIVYVFIFAIANFLIPGGFF